MAAIPTDIYQALFSRTDCDVKTLLPLFAHLYPANAHFADIYLQSYSVESISFEDSKVKNIACDGALGAGLRTCIGQSQGFAYTTLLDKENLVTTAKHAAKIASRPQARKQVPIKPSLNHVTTLRNEQNWQAKEKVELLSRLDRYARALDHDIYQVQLNIMSSLSYVLILREDGQLAYDKRPMTRIDVQLFVEKNKQRETAYAGGGGPIIWDIQEAFNKAKCYVDEAYRMVLVNFEAKQAPTGQYDLVLGAGWPGILLHEAVGHGLEADFNRKKTSIYSDKIGESIASNCCTVIDDGTLSGARGSLGVDDEGTPVAKNTLIENGVLKKYMNCRQDALLMGVEPTGNGRRQSFRYCPMPRMTNTYLAPGKYSHQEILDSLEDGIYAANFGGGSVDITSGQFVFSACEAYRVKQGKVLYPIKDMTLIGSGHEVMQQILMVGDDLTIDPGIGTCGKNGQSVPVTVGQPTIKVRQVTLGGTQNDS